MASVGWPASYPDIDIVQQCNLFRDRAKRARFFALSGEISVIADQGFFSAEFPGFMTPIASVHSAAGITRWLTLTGEERAWSSSVSREEVKIENCFAHLFVKKWKLLKRGPEGLCKDPLRTAPRIITAGAILYNLEIILSGRSFLDGSQIFDALNSE